MSHLFFVFAGITFIAFLILIHPTRAQGTPLADSIKKTYTPDATYLTPPQADLKKAKKLFYDLFSSSNFQTDEKAWDSLGFTVEKTGSFVVNPNSGLEITKISLSVQPFDCGASHLRSGRTEMRRFLNGRSCLERRPGGPKSKDDRQSNPEFGLLLKKNNQSKTERVCMFLILLSPPL